ncbi:glycosyltransferase [Actinacidiphila alni]|uniref:glycosyltransferase n=1 Tax=Actinacidiphila alni TaxID=380248 RepID=UPI0034546308
MPQHLYELAGLTVLHVSQPVEGGVARVVTDLVRAQLDDGMRPVVACPPDGALPEAAAAAGARVVRWPAGRSPGPGLARETRAVGRLIRAVRPDLLHVHSAKAGLAVRLAVRGTRPTVFQPHAWSFDAVGGATARAALRWERYAARWADRVLCVSEAERRAGQDAGVPGRWAVVPNGVDLDRFAPGGGEDAGDGGRGEGVRRGGLPALHSPPGLSGVADDAPLVVCVGRLCAQKGQDVLLRAWPRVSAALPEARLVLVGDGPALRSLLRDAPPGVLFAGGAADTAPWYRAADVAVLPSRWEGMALAPLEAMACGRPVVLTDVSGARESVPAADAASAVVPVGDERALADALLALLTDPVRRAAAGRRALAHVRERHDVRRTAAAVAELYGEVLALPGPRPRPPLPRPARRGDRVAR